VVFFSNIKIRVWKRKKPYVVSYILEEVLTPDLRRITVWRGIFATWCGHLLRFGLRGFCQSLRSVRHGKVVDVA